MQFESKECRSLLFSCLWICPPTLRCTNTQDVHEFPVENLNCKYWNCRFITVRKGVLVWMNTETPFVSVKRSETQTKQNTLVLKASTVTLTSADAFSSWRLWMINKVRVMRNRGAVLCPFSLFTRNKDIKPGKKRKKHQQEMFKNFNTI